MFDWKTHQIKFNSETSSCRQWRAAIPSGNVHTQRITTISRHSNPVIRSLYSSNVRLFKKKGGRHV